MVYLASLVVVGACCLGCLIWFRVLIGDVTIVVGVLFVLGCLGCCGLCLRWVVRLMFTVYC